MKVTIAIPAIPTNAAHAIRSHVLRSPRPLDGGAELELADVASGVESAVEAPAIAVPWLTVGSLAVSGTYVEAVDDVLSISVPWFTSSVPVVASAPVLAGVLPSEGGVAAGDAAAGVSEEGFTESPTGAVGGSLAGGGGVEASVESLAAGAAPYTFEA
jgi:hypothetical protein